MAEIYRWNVYFKGDDSSLSRHIGRFWGVSDREACNRARCKDWGKTVPLNRLGGALFAERDDTVRPIQRDRHRRPQQKQLFR